MPYPFVRADERPKEAGPVPGVRVTAHARGQRWFFPGATPEQAMTLVRAAFYDATLDHPMTEIEFGSKDGAAWVSEQVLKALPKVD